jgi:hypothetical protein
MAPAMPVHPMVNTDGRIVLFPHFCIVPGERASRLDRPPEELLLA